MLALWPREPWGVLARLVILYAGLVVGIFVFQRRLLFFPERYAPAAARSRAAEAGLVLWSAGATEYSGFLAEPRGTAAKGTVVVFHGNAGDASARAYYAAALVPRGFRVLLAEYPAYGARSGRLGESPLVADGVTTVRHVRQVFGQPTIVLGESVGAGVAAAVAGVLGTNGVDGLVLVTPWDSLTHLAQRRYWFLPVRLLLRDRFDNIAHANAYGGPVAVVVAEDDRIVPRCHADALYGALRVPKRRWVLPNCGHNDWPADADSRWWDEVMAFVRK